MSSIGSSGGLDALAAAATDPVGIAALRKAMNASASASLQLLQTLPPVEPHRGSTFDLLA